MNLMPRYEMDRRRSHRRAREAFEPGLIVKGERSSRYALAAGARIGVMALRNRLRDGLRPWHGVMLAVFVAGTGITLLRAGIVTGETVLRAVLSGLFGLLIFQFTLGNVWGYAVEYYNAGGSWTDLPFLTPFVAAGVAGVALGFYFESVAVAAWVAFWVFVAVAALVALGAWFVTGYREVGPS